MNSDRKDSNLKRRLDVLESQLLALHAAIAKRQESANNGDADARDRDSSKPATVHSQPMHQLKVVHSRYKKTSERRLVCNQELCDYLANITKHIANGSNAIEKIANLTKMYENPSIKTILLPREHFYNFAPELSNLDANFALELKPENPLVNLCKKNIKGSRTENSSCPCRFGDKKTVKPSCSTLKSSCTTSSVRKKTIGINTIESIEDSEEKLNEEICKRKKLEKEYHKLRKDSQKKVDLSLKRAEQLEDVLEHERKNREIAEALASQLEKEIEYMAEKLCRAAKKKRKSERISREVEENETIRQTQVYEPLAYEDKNTGDSKVEEDHDEVKEDHDEVKEDHDKVEEDKDKDGNLEEEIESLKQQLKAEQDMKAECLERAALIEKQLEELKLQNEAEAEKQAAEIKELRSSYDELVMSKKRSEQALAEELQEESHNRKTSVRDLTDKVYELRKNLEARDEKIRELTDENANLNKELEAIKAKVAQNEEQLEEYKKQVGSENSTLTSNFENLKNINEDLEKRLLDTEAKLKQLEADNESMKSELTSKNEQISNLQAELNGTKDTIKIKDTMLDDQLDTIKSLKAASDHSKLQLAVEEDKTREQSTSISNLKEENAVLNGKVNNLENNLRKADSFKRNQGKNLSILKELERKICEKQHEWELEMGRTCKERDEAVKTARFASRKLVQVVNDYESQVKAQKQCADLLKASLNEKEHRLCIANQQIEALNTQVWHSTKLSEKLKCSLKYKVTKACELCADLIEDCCCTTNSEGFKTN